MRLREDNMATTINDLKYAQMRDYTSYNQMQQAQMQQGVSQRPPYEPIISVPGIPFDKVTTKEIEINKLLLLEEDV